jgi:predicted phosphodiesterase
MQKGGNALIDDLVPIIHRFPNGQDIKVYPISDLHVGSPQFDSKKWDAFRARLISEPNSRIVIAGDMMNNAVKSSKSNCYEEVLRPSQQKAWLIEQLEPIKNRILCGCSGNHERRTSKEVDQHPLYDVFVKLDIESLYRENGCFLIMRFGSDDKAQRKEQAGKDRPCYATVITHGTGGGLYVGSSANKAEQFGSVIDGTDVVIMGHVHKPSEMPVAKLFIDKHNNKVIEQQFRIVIATSWISYGGYGFSGAMKPTAHLLHEITYGADSKLIKVTS